MSRHVSTESMTSIQKTIHTHRSCADGLFPDLNLERYEHLEVLIPPPSCSHPDLHQAFTTFQEELIDLTINRRIDHQPGHAPSLQVQSLLDLVQEMLADLVNELRKQYSEVEVKLSIVAD